MTSPHDPNAAPPPMVWDPATSTYQQVSEVPVNGAGWEAPAYRTAEMPTVGRYPAGVATEAGYPPPQPDYANGLQPAPTPVQAPQPYPAQQPGPVPNQLPSPPADPVPWSDPAGGQAGLQSAPAVGQAPVDPWANGAGYAHPTTEQPVHANGQPRMYYPEPAPGNGQAPVHQQSPAAGPAGWPSQAHEDAYAAPAMPQPAAVQAAPGASNGYANGFAEQSSGLHQPPYANGYGQPDQDAAGHVDQPSGNYPPQPFPAQSPPYGSHPQSAAPIAPVEGQAAPPQSWPEPPPPAGLTEPAWVPPAPPPGDQWVAVDPSAFSNPYTESPVYTSGPQPVQTAPPPAYYAPQPQQPDPLVVPVPVGHVPYQGLQQPPFPPPAGPEPGPVAEAGRSADDTYRPEQGELGIKERRSWKTWQLLVAVLVAAVVGMAINGATGSSSSAGAGSNSSAAGGSGGGYKLPPPSSGAVTTTAPANAGGGTSTAAGGSSAAGKGTSKSSSSTTVTTAAAAGGAAAGSSTTTSSVAVGPATILIPETQQTGNWTSPAFTIAGGTWNIGWAFQCTPAPSAPPSFQIFAVNNGAAPGSTPAVTSSAAAGNSVTPLTSTGSQQIIVQTTAACRWAVKVTGSSS